MTRNIVRHSTYYALLNDSLIVIYNLEAAVIDAIIINFIIRLFTIFSNYYYLLCKDVFISVFLFDFVIYYLDKYHGFNLVHGISSERSVIKRLYDVTTKHMCL